MTVCEGLDWITSVSAQSLSMISPYSCSAYDVDSACFSLAHNTTWT